MNIKKTFLRWTVAALAVLMLAACGSSPSSSPATENTVVQKAQTGQVTFAVQFPHAALKKALIDDRTASIYVQWRPYMNYYSPVTGSIELIPDALTGIATATIDVPVGAVEFIAIARDSNFNALDTVTSAGEITTGSNTVTMTFLGGDWQFVDSSDNLLPQTFGATTLAGFTLNSLSNSGPAKATTDPTKPRSWSDYSLQWQSTTAAIGPLMWSGQTTQFNALNGTGSSFGSDWINTTEPTRSDTLEYDMSLPYQQGDRLVWFMEWEDDGPATITDDTTGGDLIPQFKTFADTQVLDGNHLGGHLLAMTFESLVQSAPISTGVDCTAFWYAQQPVTPAAARATAIKSGLTKSASKAAVGDEAILAAGTITANYTDCYEDYPATPVDGDGDGDNLYEELTFDANGNWRFDAGDSFIDSDGDLKWDYTYYPGTTYSFTEVYSNVVAREFRAKGSPAGSVYTPAVPTAFSTDWLNGKTLYQVWFGTGEDSFGNTLQDVPVVAEVTFSNGTITYNGLMNSWSGSGTYDVNVFGMLTTNGDATSGNTVVSGSTAQYIKTHYTINNVFDNVDLYFFNQAEAMAYASGLTASIPATTAMNALGTWMTIDPTTNEVAVLAFVDSSKYLMGEDGVGDAGGGPGIEVGTYSFNPTTAETTFSVTYETNGDWGPATVSAPTSYPISDLSEIVMTVVDPSDFSSFSFNRVTTDPLNPIIGSWYFTGTGMGETILVLLNNGQYYAVQVDSADAGNRFFESGTYTWNSIDETFVGTGVFSSNISNAAIAAPGDINTANVTVSGNSLDFFDGVTTYTATRL